MMKIIKKRGFKYLMAFLIPFVILLSMTIKPAITNALGSEILIKTKPFDPRDVFRGDYIYLNYEINEITLDKLDNSVLNIRDDKEEYEPFKELRKKNLYVTLKESKGVYEVDKVSLNKPNEGIYLKAKYRYTLQDMPEKEDENINKEKEKYVVPKAIGINVDYSLDKYFVPENTGKDLEDKAQKGELLAKIKVYKGYSLLKEVVEK